MKIILSLLCLIVAAKGFSQNQTPILPHTEASYSRKVEDSLSPGKFLPDGQWAYDVNIQNVNDKPVFCKKVYFTAYLDVWGNACQNPDYAVFIPIGKDNSTNFELPEKGSLNILKAGNAERENREKSLAVNTDDDLDNNVRLQICRRDPINMDCGFVCEGGIKHDDEVTLLEKNASVTKLCLATGKLQVKKVVCSDSTRFEINASGDGCEPKSCRGRAHGAEWESPVRNGTAYYMCDYGSETYSRTVCKDSSYFEVSGVDCKPKTVSYKYYAKELQTQCAVHDAFPGAIFIPASYVCHVNQFMAFGPSMNLPYPGYISVKFFINAIQEYTDRRPQQIPASNSPIARFDIYSSQHNRVYAEKTLRAGDLERRNVDPNFGTFVLQYTGGVPAPQGLGGRSYNLDAELSEAAGGMEFRVQFLDAGEAGFTPSLTNVKSTQFSFSGLEVSYTPYP